MARSIVCRITCVMLASLSSTVPVSGQETHSISNGYVTVGVNTNWGGSITRLDYRVGEVVRINNVDNSGGPGRQIEAAIYDAESTSPDCWPAVGSLGSCQPNPSCPWKWNPVQAGDACGYGSAASVIYQTGTRIITRTTPLQWNRFWPSPSRVTLDQDVEILSANLVRVTYTVTNGEDFTVNSEHELPVAYLNNYSTGLYYESVSPWTRDMNVTQRTFAPGDKRNRITTTESWIGFSNVNSACGLANCESILLHVPDAYSVWNIGRMEDGVALLQAWQGLTLLPGETRTVTAFLAVGRFSDAREAVYLNTGHEPPPPPTPTGPDILNADEAIYPNQWISSSNGAFDLAYQSDGNLVLYRYDGFPVWASNTAGTSAGRALMQGDGNFVIYNASGMAVWHTGTWGNPGAYLKVEGDGHITVYSSVGVVLWREPNGS